MRDILALGASLGMMGAVEPIGSRPVYNMSGAGYDTSPSGIRIITRRHLPNHSKGRRVKKRVVSESPRRRGYWIRGREQVINHRP